MLRSIRDSSQGIFAKIILGLIIVTFAFFGFESIGGGGGVPAVLEVNGQEIDENAFRKELDVYRRQLIAQMGDDVDFTLLDDERLAPRVLARLTERTLLEQALEEVDVLVPEAMVERSITEMEAFKVDGQFSPQLMASMLRDRGMSLSDLKDQRRVELQTQQLQLGLGMSSFVLPQSTELMLDIMGESRIVDWLRIPAASVRASVVLSEEDISRFYESERESYQSELQVVAEYIELRLSDLYEPVAEEDILDAFESRRDSLTSPEQREVAHILFEVSDGQSFDDALARAETVREELVAGGDFAALAKEYSQDIGSASGGGSLGYISQDGTFPEAFESAVFRLALNEVSAPVESDAGVHLLTVTAIEQSEEPAIADFYDEIKQEIQASAARSEFVIRIEELADMAFNAADLEQPASALDLERKRSVRIARGGPVEPGPGAVPFDDRRLVSTLFSEDVLERGQNSEVIELSPERAVVLRVAEVFEPRQLSLGEVRDQIETTLREQRADELLQAQFQALQKAVEEGGVSLVEAAAEQGFSVSEDAELTRTSADVDIALLKAAFDAPRSLAGQARLSQASADNGDRIAFVLERVEPASADQFFQGRDVFEQQLQGIAGQQDLVAFMQELRERSEIVELR